MIILISIAIVIIIIIYLTITAKPSPMNYYELDQHLIKGVPELDILGIDPDPNDLIEYNGTVNVSECKYYCDNHPKCNNYYYTYRPSNGIGTCLLNNRTPENMNKIKFEKMDNQLSKLISTRYGYNRYEPIDVHKKLI